MNNLNLITDRKYLKDKIVVFHNIVNKIDKENRFKETSKYSIIIANSGVITINTAIITVN